MRRSVSTPVVRRLDELPYLGATRRSLLRALGVETPEQLLALSDEEIGGISYLGVKNADKLRRMVKGELPIPPLRRPRAETVAGASGSSGSTDAAQEAAPGDSRPISPTASAAPLQPETDALEQGTGANGQVGTEAAVEPESPERRAAALDYAAAIAVRRGQMPEAVTALTDAIRASAVSCRLERQTTRLLETLETVAARQDRLPDRNRRRAALLLNRAHGALRRATVRQRFSPKQQRALADRLAQRCDRLEKLVAKGE